MENTLKLTVKAVIPPRDNGLRKLIHEYSVYKKVLIPKVRDAVRRVIKDKNITVYSQQKWQIDKKLNNYLKNLPFHPMPFHNQSVDIYEKDGKFWIHFRTKQGWVVCYLHVPPKYRDIIKKACGKANPILGQVELIEDRKYGWVNCHITLRLPKPKPYKPKGWIGVDVGWNNLAVSVFMDNTGKISHVDFHGKEWKTRIIQLKYLLKIKQRSGSSWKVWNFRLKHTREYTVGVIAKAIVTKAKKLKAGVAMEKLTFRSSTKKWGPIPYYKLRMAIQTLCERNGVPFKLVPAKNTSIKCNRCGYINKANRNGETFKCLKCGYQANADFNAAVNIAAIAVGYKPTAKKVRLQAETLGDVATPVRGMSDDLNKRPAKPAKSKR